MLDENDDVQTCTPTTIYPRKRWPLGMNALMATTQFVKSERLRKLPPYLFAEIDKKKKAAIAAGRDVIRLESGDLIAGRPRSSRPPATCRESGVSSVCSRPGAPELRRSIAAFCKSDYAIDLDPETEILALIGSKEGLPTSPWLCSILVRSVWFLIPATRSTARAACSLVATCIRCLSSLASRFRPDLDTIPADVYALACSVDVSQLSQQPNRSDGRSPIFAKVVEHLHTTLWLLGMPPVRCISTKPPRHSFEFGR